MNQNPETWPKERLVRFLAEEGMGWKRWPKAPSRDSTWHEAYWGDSKGNKIKAVFRPLTSGDDMLRLIEGMWKRYKARGSVTKMPTGKFYAYFVSGLWGRCQADTAQRAVCLAAAKALLAGKETTDEN